MVVLIRKDGVLKIWEEKDITKEKWQYRQTDPTEAYTLVDLDYGVSQPLIKSILNALELFPEIRMLRTLQWMSAGLILLAFITFCLVIFRLPTASDVAVLGKSVATMKDQGKPDAKAKIKDLLDKASNQQVPWTAQQK